MATIMHTLSDMVTPKPTALVPVADGSEEIEVAALSTVLARAGVRVTIAGVNENRVDHVVTLAQGTMIKTDKAIEHCANDEFDAIVVPGGSGAKVLGASATLVELLRKQKATGKLFGAICAAPVDVLQRHQLLNGSATCLPALKTQLGELFIDENVVVTGNCVTSQSPGTAIRMALTLVSLLRGDSTAQEVTQQLSA